MDKIKQVVLCLVFLIWLPVNAAVASQPTITEWQVPYKKSRPRDPYVDTKGIVWFVGQTDDYVASFNPLTEKFRRYPLASGTGPHNLIVTSDDTIWYAGNRAKHIGKLNAADGKIHKIVMPKGVRDPHTLVFDAAGDIWFTAQGANYVGKLTLKGEVVRTIPVPTRGARPYGINVAPDGQVWVCLFGTNKLAHIDAKTFALTEIELPRSSARPRRLEITSDGMVWYVDYAQGYLGKLDPESGEFEEWRMPSGGKSFPYAMEVDQQDMIWFVETGPKPNQFVGFDTRDEMFTTAVPLESGGGSVRHMHYDKASNSIWFGADTNTIGRAVLPDAEE